MYKLEFHEEVKKDVENAFKFYDNKSSKLGVDLLKSIELKLEKIKSNPKTFSSKTNTKFREAKVGVFPYIIVYQIFEDKNVVFISSIHHGKKNPLKKFRSNK